jgi:hypothetical protein
MPVLHVGFWVYLWSAAARRRFYGENPTTTLNCALFSTTDYQLPTTNYELLPPVYPYEPFARNSPLPSPLLLTKLLFVSEEPLA